MLYTLFRAVIVAGFDKGKGSKSASTWTPLEMVLR